MTTTNENTYQDRINARKERYEEKADELRRQSNSLAREARGMASNIPCGQPIHGVRDRNYRARIGKKMDAAVNAQQKSDYYAKKAERVGTGGISNIDPDAQAKIREKIERLKLENERGKEANKVWRKLYKSAMAKVNDDKKEAFFAAIEDFKSTHPRLALELAQLANFYYSPNYSKLKPFSPDTAEINRLKKRLEFLENQSKKESITIEKSAYKCVQDTDEMRVYFDFHEKPSEEVRDILKSCGFKWSHYAKVWTRKLTPNAIGAARSVISQLNGMNIT